MIMNDIHKKDINFNFIIYSLKCMIISISLVDIAIDIAIAIVVVK